MVYLTVSCREGQFTRLSSNFTSFKKSNMLILSILKPLRGRYLVHYSTPTQDVKLLIHAMNLVKIAFERLCGLWIVMPTADLPKVRLSDSFL